MQDDNQVVDASKSLYKVASYDAIVYALISKTYYFIGNNGADRSILVWVFHDHERPLE